MPLSTQCLCYEHCDLLVAFLQKQFGELQGIFQLRDDLIFGSNGLFFGGNGLLEYLEQSVDIVSEFLWKANCRALKTPGNEQRANKRIKSYPLPKYDVLVGVLEADRKAQDV